MIVNEEKCTIELNGMSFTNRGAFVDENFAHVYVDKLDKNTHNLKRERIKVATWNGEILGYGSITSTWKINTMFGPCNMVQVHFKINGVNYSGRFNYDNGQLVRAKKVK